MLMIYYHSNLYPLQSYTMTREKQYTNLLLLFKEFWNLDTDIGQKEYYKRHWHTIQIGTRYGDLVRSGYLIKYDVKWMLKQYELSMKGIEWKEWDYILINRKTKEQTMRGNREESIVKQECKEWKTEVKEKEYPIQPTTSWGKIKYFLFW